MFFVAYQAIGDQRNGYGGRQLAAAFDPATMTMDWVKEQTDWYGYSGTLVYKNYGAGQANLFVAGSIDSTYTSTNNKDWKLGVTRLTESGTTSTNGAFLIEAKSGGFDKHNEHPWINHMHIDDVSIPGEEWLFGSTEYNKNNRAGEEVYLWKVKLDASHNPDPAQLTCI